ncbi:MAG TPA: acetyl-CoA carboxylase biotin carboxyl carrier protein subunit [Bacteroidia bacterium]|nr:acetyl-CoA carboxylase biotin carboxyl carrier protein subunit [Bacteroidia bacterium]
MYKVKVNNKEFEAEFEGGKKEISGRTFEADILEYKNDKFHIIRDNKSLSAEIVEANYAEKTFIIKVNNHDYTVSIKDKYDILLREMGIDIAAGRKVNDIKAPMPGLVLNVLVENGQKIIKGDGILVLEAMKMENVLKAPADAVVKKIRIAKGDKVEKNQIMIDLG